MLKISLFNWPWYLLYQPLESCISSTLSTNKLQGNNAFLDVKLQQEHQLLEATTFLLCITLCTLVELWLLSLSSLTLSVRMFNHLLLLILTAALCYIKNSVSPVIVFSHTRSSFLLPFLPILALSHSYSSSVLICVSQP